MKRLGNLAVGHSKLALWGFVALILLSTVWNFQAFAGLKAFFFVLANCDRW